MGGFKKVLGAAAPILGTAVGGPLGGAIGGAAGGLLSGAPQQAERDSAQARKLAGEAVDSSKRGARGATQQFGLSAPLRDAFRTGALAQADPTNPFSRDIFGGFANLLQQESGPQGVGTGFEAQAPQAPQDVGPSNSGNGLLDRVMNQTRDARNQANQQAHQQQMQQFQQANPFQVGAQRFGGGQ